MNYLFKVKSLLLLCVILQACSTSEKTDIDKVDTEKVTSATTDQAKKKGIVLIMIMENLVIYLKVVVMK